MCALAANYITASVLFVCYTFIKPPNMQPGAGAAFDDSSNDIPIAMERDQLESSGLQSEGQLADMEGHGVESRCSIFGSVRRAILNFWASVKEEEDFRCA
jgi:hypothetical protein